MFKITFFSAWVSPQIFFAYSIEELKEIVFEGKQAHYEQPRNGGQWFKVEVVKKPF